MSTIRREMRPNKAEMVEHGKTSQVKRIECAVTVKKKVMFAARDDDRVGNHLLFVARITPVIV